jgi:hypothetical protein
MPSIGTQTENLYVVIDDPSDTEILSTIRQITSKYNGNNIFIFYKYYKSEGNDKNTMTSYNSKNKYYMDMFIQQIIDSGDY